MYRYQVNFDKVFTSGVLKGRRYTNSYLRFVDWKSADSFARECDGKTVVSCCAGTGDYIREDAILSAIEPTTTAQEARK
jgi:hypothetical protein